MTEAAWMKRYEAHVAGLALFGHCDSIAKGPLERAASAMNIPDEVRALLHQMFKDAQQAEPPKPTNGAFPPKATTLTKGTP